MRLRFTLVGAVVGCALLGPGPAGTAWRQPAGGASPINQANNRDAFEPSLAVVGGVPYVAWYEHDGTNDELRVSRLNADGTAWEQPVGGASPINEADNRDAQEPSLAAVGGAPYVAWRENDGNNFQLRVSRLNADGTAWEQPVGGASPINHDEDRSPEAPSLADVAGVPYVAWAEFDGVNAEIRVSRLNAAGTAWEQPVGGASPINQSPTQGARFPSLANVGGVPYVAWQEFDGTNFELRVSRLNAAGTAWEQVVGGASPINQANDRSAVVPSLAAVGGVPYVAWIETDGTNFEVRASRLNAAGTAWQQVVGGTSPINHANDRSADTPSLANFGGVPYVAWNEDDGTNEELRVSRLNAAGVDAWEQVVGGTNPINRANNRDGIQASLANLGGAPYVASVEFDATNFELRVSRLEPDFFGVGQTVADTSATVAIATRTYGVDYPIGFEYGPGPGFDMQTPPQNVQSGNGDTVDVTQPIGGLAPSTQYSWRAFGSDGAHQTAVSATTVFTTAGTAGGTPGLGGLASDTKAPVLAASAARAQRVLKQRAVIVSVGVDEAATATGTGTISVPKLARTFRLKSQRKAVTAGKRTRLTLKLTRATLKAVRKALGRKRLYAKVTVTVADRAGNRAAKRLNIRLKR